MKNRLLLLLAMVGIGVQAQTVKLPRLGKDRIDRIVAAMSLQEKAQLLVGVSDSVSHTYVGNLKDAIPAAGVTARLAQFGITPSYMCDGPCGVRMDTLREGSTTKYYATGFPVETLLASTWNTSLLYKVGQTMGNEVKEYGCDVLLAPGLNIHRNPLCGRNFEYYSEDPVLTGKMAAAMVGGLQSQGVGATIKHFVANNQQTMRVTTDSRVAQRPLREIYLRGFEIAVKDAQPWAVMSSYNKLNGVYTQEDHPLLSTTLRDEWGFKGIVMTDWTGTRNTVAQVHAGNDLMMEGNPEQVRDIVKAVQTGRLSIADVNRNVKRMLEFLLKTPHFKAYPFSNAPDLKAHAQVVREAADEGIVLLKNDSCALPFPQATKRVALFGIGAYNFYAGGRGSADVNKTYIVNMKQGLTDAGLTLVSKLDRYYTKYIDWQKSALDEINVPDWYTWFFGPKMPQEAEIDTAFIRLRAKEADVAVYTIARNAGEGADRHNIEGDYLLTKSERLLLENITAIFHSLKKKVVVVLNTGGEVETASWKSLPDAIVLAWQPGQEGGRPVADVLTGKVNPSGKLPVTFANDYFDIPSSKNFPYDYFYKDYTTYWADWTDSVMLKTKDRGFTNYEEGIWVGYRYFNTFKKAVSYPFGYGLSYTTFGYTDAHLKQSGNHCVVTVKVKNTGAVTGKEVVELYTTAPRGKLEKPARELKAFAKTKLLQPGESETVTMHFTLPDLASFDEQTNSWITEAGKYVISVGASVEDIRQTLSFNVHHSIKCKMLKRL